ncbi:malate dehydrogenase-like protein [Bisporella sp. PMI_857]|nr:malate dehydrogenase-like protein [Bisporella sp. PMI_857]
MLFKFWAFSALCAVTMSAPTLSYNAKAVEPPANMKVLAEYFQLLASKIQAGKNMAQAPVCNLANAKLPASGIALPAPGAGLVLKHVAIGRGTQNYTCGANATAAPTALGAVATLYNASCLASAYPDLLESIPNLALQFNLPPSPAPLTPSNLIISGHHYFPTNTLPLFDLTTTTQKLGVAPCAKNSSTPAPAGASVGQGGKGLGAVDWLKLVTKDAATNPLQEVYRVNTAGGKAPATCAGITDTSFEVQYATEYWFYAK